VKLPPSEIECFFQKKEAFLFSTEKRSVVLEVIGDRVAVPWGARYRLLRRKIVSFRLTPKDYSDVDLNRIRLRSDKRSIEID
jgi:hypothetical protein